jgi:hypothetical protein
MPSWERRRCWGAEPYPGRAARVAVLPSRWRWVAPPCLLYAADGTTVAPKLAGVQWIYADRLKRLRELGFMVAYGSLRGPDGPERVQAFGQYIVPVVSDW